MHQYNVFLIQCCRRCTVGLQALLVRCSGHFVALVQWHDDRLNLIQSNWCITQDSHSKIIASCWTPTQGSLCWSLHSMTGGGGSGVSGRQASLWVVESSVVAVKFAFNSTQPGQGAAGRTAVEKPAEVFFFFYQVETRTAAAIIKKHFIFRHITQQQLHNSVHLRFLFFLRGA